MAWMRLDAAKSDQGLRANATNCSSKNMKMNQMLCFYVSLHLPTHNMYTIAHICNSSEQLLHRLVKKIRSCNTMQTCYTHFDQMDCLHCVCFLDSVVIGWNTKGCFQEWRHLHIDFSAGVDLSKIVGQEQKQCFEIEIIFSLKLRL